MTNQLEALIADMKAAAEKANQANELYLDGKIRLSECSAEIKDYLDYSDDPKNMLALIAALEREREKSRRVMSQLEASQSPTSRPVMFIDGDISPADAEKLANVITEWVKEDSPSQETVKLPPHKFSECVNGLLEEAIAYAGTQQLRSRLASRLSNFVKPDHAAGITVQGDE